MKRLLSLAAAAVLAGCAGTSSPPPSPADGSATSGQLRAVPPRTIPMLVTVERGETLYGIARRWGVNPQVVIDTNRLRPPYMLLIGQRLIMPVPDPGAPPETAVAARDPAPVPAVSGAPATHPPAATADTAATTIERPAPEPAAGGAAEPETASLPPAAAPPAGNGPAFVWPVAGNVVSGFGAKGNGLYNDGIDIAAPAGTPVRAASGGVVVYAGNELEGFGHMVLIRHSGGWMTAYAHNQELLVRRGETVSQGQVIARVGSSGRATRPQLHFEIRRGKQAVDPLTRLPRSAA